MRNEHNTTWTEDERLQIPSDFDKTQVFFVVERIVMMSRVNMSWLLYAFLLLFRIIVGPFLLGYVHPDEFYQGGQELFFGCPPTIPWEFEPVNALRSVVPPTLMTWLPLQIYNWLRMMIRTGFDREELIVGMGSLSGIEVLIVPRMACSLFSILVIDWSVWSICATATTENSNMKENRIPNTTRIKGGVPVPVLLLASAWPTMVMLSRPFSNSMESYILALLMTTVLTIRTNDKHEFLSKSSVGVFFCWKIGTICAFGIFTRFTFVFFAFPVLLFLLYKMVQNFGIWKAILWRKLGWMTISFLCVALGIVLADTQFYSSRHNQNIQQVPSLFNYSSLVLTPFNALAYNSKISNLKDHGLHPRWTHAVVNMLIMYGPLAVATYLSMPTSLLNGAGGNRTSDTRNRNTIEKGGILMVSRAVVIFGLGFLSIAPHQEPRFLLPLIIPLVLLGEKPIQRFPTIGPFVWILFNLILFALFGILHQGGVTQSLLAVGSTTTWAHPIQPTSWIYLRTYMPPTFLTRLSRDTVADRRTCSNDDEKYFCQQISFDMFGRELDDACQKEKARIVDLNGSGLEKLWDTLQTELPCSKSEGASDSNAFIYLVVPFMAENENNDESGFIFSSTGHEGRCQLPSETYECDHVRSYGPHLTTEDFPPFGVFLTEFYNTLALNVYNISCTTII